MRAFFLFTFFIYPYLAIPQEIKTIYGSITDAQNGDPVRDARVYFENNPDNYVLSNSKGNFSLQISKETIISSWLVVKSVFHDPYRIKIEPEKCREDSIRIDMSLSFFTLPSVDVLHPDTIFHSGKISVSDFEFHGDNFIMLAYEKRLTKESKVLYVNRDNKILSSFTVPDIAKELYRDFMGKVHVVCENRVFVADVQDDIIQLYPLEKSYFEDQIKPWVDTSCSRAYFSNFAWYYPEFDYYAYNLSDSTYKKIRTICDKPLMDLYRAQYKYVDGRDKLDAYRAELKTGIDKEIWVAIWSGFPNSIYYDALYAPMFIQNDTILIFDHYSSRLHRYSASLDPLDSVSISYHTDSDSKTWRQRLIRDDETGKIYSLYLRDGKSFLKELNTATGEVQNTYVLYFRYVENIRIKGGFAYYIYRPYESAQKKFLYKEYLRPLD